MAASASIAALLRHKPSCKTFSAAPTSTPIFLPHFKEVVLLHDWWLIKSDSDAHGKQLGVGGFTTKEFAMIFFWFPYYWEEFAALSFDRLEITSENSEHVSFDALPITIQRGLLIGNFGHHEFSLASKNIFYDMLQSTGAGTSSNDGELGSKKANPFNMKSTVSTLDEALLKGLRSKAQRKQKGSKVARIAEASTNVKLKLMQENNDVASRGVLTSGPLTRSRSRLIMMTA